MHSVETERIQPPPLDAPGYPTGALFIMEFVLEVNFIYTKVGRFGWVIAFDGGEVWGWNELRKLCSYATVGRV